MYVHAALAKGLSELGVNTMFGIIGDANLFMVDSWVRNHGGKYVSSANEEGAVLMANGYASVTGKLGVATVTHGPALTNTLTALAEVVKNQVPLLLIAGDTAVDDKLNLQNLPQRDYILATGAGFEQGRSAGKIVEDLAVAARRAIVERRPVVLNMPVELQWQEVQYEAPTVVVPEQQAVGPDPRALDRAVGIIASSRRPIVLAGRGAATPEAREALLRLAERIGAPVATTLKGMSLFRGEPFDLGVFGTLSSPPAADAIVESDCIIAFGASLNPWTTAQGSYLEGKRVVHCEIERRHLGLFSAVDAAVVGDAAVVADTIVQWLDQADVAATDFRSDGLARALEDYSLEGFDDRSTDTTVDLRTALLAVDRAVPENRVLVTDGGRFIFETMLMMRAQDPSSFVWTVNIGSIGLGMGTAIGAGVAAEGRPVLLITGDGGFMMGGLTEFNTAVRNDVDLIVVVFNDDAYGAEHIQFRNRGMDPSLSMFGWPDLAPVAESLGGCGITIRNVKDLDGLADAIANRDRPLLIDVKLDPDQVPMGSH